MNVMDGLILAKFLLLSALFWTSFLTGIVLFHKEAS